MSLGEKRSKRLAKELRMLQNSKEDYIKDVKIIESDMDHWVVSFEDSCLPEHLACLDVYIDFPEGYPFCPPKIRIPNCHHPNIFKTGQLCISLLDTPSTQLPGSDCSIDEMWRPSLHIENVLLGTKLVLESPNVASPANVDASKLYKSNEEMYIAKNLELKKNRIVNKQREIEKAAQDKAFYEALQADKQRSEKTSSVVQMLKTEAGRISFKFSASISSPPLIGDLRNALKRARPEMNEVTLSVMRPGKMLRLEDSEELKHFERDCIIVDEE